jgi:polyhydroxyalkanoate synthase
MRARMEPGFPEAVLAAISQSTNELTQGWMRLMASAPAAADTSWLGANSRCRRATSRSRRSSGARSSAGRAEPVISPESGDRRFAHRQWNENPYYDYLKQSYLLASRYLADAVEQAALEPVAKDRARFA